MRLELTPPFPGRGVVDLDDAGTHGSLDRQELAVPGPPHGATDIRQPLLDPHGNGRLVQRLLDVLVRLRLARSEERVRLEREQAAPLGVDLEVGDRGRRERAGVGHALFGPGDGPLVVGDPALLDGNRPGHQRQHEERGGPDEEAAEAGAGAALAVGLGAGLGELGGRGHLAGGQVVVLALAEVVVVVGRPLLGEAEAAAPQQVGRVACTGVPLASGVLEPMVHLAALDVRLEPLAEARPRPQQGLVGDLHRVLAQGEQPLVHHRVQRDPGIASRSAGHVGDRHPAAQVQGAVVRHLGQPQQDPPGGRLLAARSAGRTRPRPVVRPHRSRRRPRGSRPGRARCPSGGPTSRGGRSARAGAHRWRPGHRPGSHRPGRPRAPARLAGRDGRWRP